MKNSLIIIEMFVFASCLSTTAEDRIASSGPPPTLDVLPAPGTVSPSSPGRVFRLFHIVFMSPS